MPIFVGFESANSYVKGTSSEKQGVVDTYLNTLTTATKEDYEKSQKGNITSKDEVYEVNGNYYKVNKIIKSDKTRSSEEAGPSRYKKPDWKAETLIAIYRQIKDRNNFSNQNIFVVTGLPVDHSYDPEIRGEIIKFLEGYHEVNGKGIRIVGADVITQAESTFFDELLDLKGDFNEEFLMEVTPEDDEEVSELLYLDIGHGSTDFQQVTDFTPTRRSFETGMKAVWKDILEEAKRKNGQLGAAKPKILSVIKDLEEGGIIDFKGVVVDVSDYREKRLQEYADTLIKHISQEYPDIYFDQIRITGGGSIGLKPYLQTAIQNEYNGDLAQINRFVFLENPQQTNARGYLKYCTKMFSK